MLFFLCTNYNSDSTQIAYKMSKIKVMQSDPFWFDSYDILWQSDRLNEFFPTADQTMAERFNALMRLSIYMSVLLYFHHRNFKYMFIAVGMGLFTYYVWSNSEHNTTTNIESLESSDGNCTQPTLDNPFMNVTMKDYLNIKDGKIVDRPPACDVNRHQIKKQIDDAFNNNLYRDVDDVFAKMNSQRQFYTMPWTTIPNKQDEFARWLYLNPKTCKEDQDFCLRYEDVRAKRPVMFDPNTNPAKNN